MSIKILKNTTLKAPSDIRRKLKVLDRGLRKRAMFSKPVDTLAYRGKLIISARRAYEEKGETALLNGKARR